MYHINHCLKPKIDKVTVVSNFKIIDIYIDYYIYYYYIIYILIIKAALISYHYEKKLYLK